VAVVIGGSTVALSVRVDFGCGVSFLLLLFAYCRSHTVRASRGATVGVVTELVDVDTTLGVGVVARDVP
jgi:hypothetical protein